MSRFIDLTSSTYSNLSQYAILANKALNASSLNKKIVVNRGYWYGKFNTNLQLYQGTQPSGYNNSLSSNAINELQVLIDRISTITKNLNTIDIENSGDNYTFNGNTNYISSFGPSWIDKTITFDTQGDTNAQFFITCISANISFFNCLFNLGNAKSCNIFWLCTGSETGEGSFTITNSIVPGIIIAENSISIVSDNEKSLSYYGHLYSQGIITLLSFGTGNLNINLESCGNFPMIGTVQGPEINPGRNPVDIVCYVKGTLILTKQGFIPIENIKENNEIVIKGKIYKNKFIKIDANLELTPVLWVGKIKVVDLNKKSRPICIKKNALGKNSPFRDLYVSPRHSLLINGKKVLAKNIVNEKTIFQDNVCDSVEYYHLECKDHCVIIANGILSESYLDINNRYVFENSIMINKTKLNNLVQHES
jgi:hypothetical protein